MDDQEKIKRTVKELHVDGYKKIIEAIDPSCDLHCIIAIHNTTLGPALGGLRIKSYLDREEALKDALNLAKAMTYKSAVAQNGLGGGKSVIICDARHKSEDLLISFGKVLDLLQGEYIVAEDVGSTTDDMKIIRKATPYVAALDNDKSSGDPSRFTAWGVYRGIQAVAKTLFGTRSLKKRTVAIQGLGQVGQKLAETLFWEGAELILSDIDKIKLHHLEVMYGAKTVSPEDFDSVKCDILAPCALGGTINSKNIDKLQCLAIAGSANNQLAEPQIGTKLLEKGILYAPDYIINAGGIINAAREFEHGGYDPRTSRNKVNHIYELLLKVFERSKAENRATNEIADEIAIYNLERGIGKRLVPIDWKSRVID